jgi:hypothetical protein
MLAILHGYIEMWSSQKSALYINTNPKSIHSDSQHTQPEALETPLLQA